MAKTPFKLTDLKGHEDINISFVSIRNLTGKTIIIHNSEMIDNPTPQDPERVSIRMTCTTPDNPEKFNTLSGSFIFVNLHNLLSAQGLYPIEITLNSKDGKYTIS